MLEGVTLDQFRSFVAAADKGIFSAAGRRLGRAQSVISQTLANMEGQLGIKLFDRSTRIPVLTEAGRALLPDARAVTGSVDAFRARARGLAGGLEAELSVVVDVMLPTPVLTQAVAEFALRFPAVPLRLHVEVLGAVLQPVLDGKCAFGIISSAAGNPAATTGCNCATDDVSASGWMPFCSGTDRIAKSGPPIAAVPVLATSVAITALGIFALKI